MLNKNGADAAKNDLPGLAEGGNAKKGLPTVARTSLGERLQVLRYAQPHHHYKDQGRRAEGQLLDEGGETQLRGGRRWDPFYDCQRAGPRGRQGKNGKEAVGALSNLCGSGSAKGEGEYDWPKGCRGGGISTLSRGFCRQEVPRGIE